MQASYIKLLQMFTNETIHLTNKKQNFLLHFNKQKQNNPGTTR